MLIRLRVYTLIRVLA